MNRRKSLSKSLRFEVLKRDGFRCLYCGCTPLQSALRVDHVVPVADGGGDEPSNLVTSCFDCNSGKAARRLEDRRLPVGDPEAAIEHAEQIRDYLAAQREIEAARAQGSELIAAEWERQIGPMSQEMFNRLPKLAQEWSIERLYEAIFITGKKLGRPDADFDYRAAVKQQKYFHGILRRWREEHGA